MSITNSRVSFRYDAPETSADEFAAELSEITSTRRIELDSYSRGGVVEELESAFASSLGKERALFMPTGTLANHLGVRLLMNGRSRVLVQEQGHLYNDSGDCLQRLSGINAVPLGRGRATFTLEEVVAEVDAASSGRVSTGIGAIAIETPVRRRHGELFDRATMREICVYGRNNGIGLHLDGARLYLASAFTGVRPSEYAAGFDTVYISLYKYFRAPAGAILAGPAHLLDALYQDRRMFGGSLNQAWVFAAVALKYLAGFEQRFAEVVQAASRLKSGLGAVPGLRLREVPNGTNVFQLEVDRIDRAELIKARLETNGILLPAPEGSSFYLKLNESLLHLPVDQVVDLFSEACA